MVASANSFPRCWEEPIWQLPPARLMAAFSESQQISQPNAQPRAGDHLALLLRPSAAAWPAEKPAKCGVDGPEPRKGGPLGSKKRWKALSVLWKKKILVSRVNRKIHTIHFQ